MKTLNQINEQLNAHQDELTELFKQQYQDEHQHKKDYNFLTIILLIVIALSTAMNISFANRLSQAEKNIEAMGKDLIEAKRVINMMPDQIWLTESMYELQCETFDVNCDELFDPYE